MTARVHLHLFSQFTREQLEAIRVVLDTLDEDEYRDYHDTYGLCNAPDDITALKSKVVEALRRAK